MILTAEADRAEETVEHTEEDEIEQVFTKAELAAEYERGVAAGRDAGQKLVMPKDMPLGSPKVRPRPQVNLKPPSRNLSRQHRH